MKTPEQILVEVENRHDAFVPNNSAEQAMVLAAMEEYAASYKDALDLERYQNTLLSQKCSEYADELVKLHQCLKNCLIVKPHKVAVEAMKEMIKSTI